MTTVENVYDFINSFASFETAADWDNSGLLVGDGHSAVTGILVALDVTENEIEQASENGCSLIVSHHPVIFHPVKCIEAGTPVYDAVRNGIDIISVHTNLDKASDGVNDVLCKRLGLEFVKEPGTVGDGFLNIGRLPSKKTLIETAEYISECLKANVRFNGGKAIIERVAVCSGAGSDLLREAKYADCDALITGDASYHDFLDAESLGMTLFAAGHFETEVIVLETLAEKLRNEFPDMAIIISERKSPVETVVYNGC